MTRSSWLGRLSAVAVLAALAWPELAEAHYNGRYHRHSYVVVERPAVEVLTVGGIPVLIAPVRREPIYRPVYRPVRVYRRRY